MSRHSKNVILGVSAGIAIYKACEIARRLNNLNTSIDVVMTRNAARLVSWKVFASLINGKVYTDGFNEPQEWTIEHISLAKKASLVLIAPATANIIGKIANGIADDLLTTTIIATCAPVVIAPAMNDKMYLNEIVQGNITKLKNHGYQFIEPTKGRLACGDVGIGHLAEVDFLIKEVKKRLSLAR